MLTSSKVSTTVVGCFRCERPCEESRHEGLDKAAMEGAVAQAKSMGWKLIDRRNRQIFVCPKCQKLDRTLESLFTRT